jgi:predicted nucleic acid-binding protein
LTSFVDTNIFIHYLLGYDQKRFDACRQLLRAAEQRQADLETSVMVLAELIWFLERPPLGMSGADVNIRIQPLLRLGSLRLPDRELVAAALEQHANSSMNFVDALNMMLMQKRRITRIYSYDTDFDGIPSVERVEP